MSGNSYSYSSTSYSSYSSTDGQGGTHSYSEETYTDPSGTQRRTVTKEPGRPAVEERSSFPAGRQVEANAATSGQGRIQDVTDKEETEADKRYRENMEEEYAKREGGA